MKKGFLYVANRQKFIEEALISLRSLKRFNSDPVCLICTSDLQSEKVKKNFDIVIENDELLKHTYLSKVIGMQNSPFERTIFLDSDTFVADQISELFDLLDLVDFSTTLEQKQHTTKLKNLSYRNIFPEFNSGVVVYRKSPVMNKVFCDWLQFCMENKIGNDMPGLREAVLKNLDQIKFSILPNCYNEHGFASMLQLDQKVKVIHERIGYQKGVITPHFADFETMEKFANKLNEFTHKRFYIPKIGIISYRWSPLNIILYFKRKLGFKRVSKSR